MDDTLMTDEFQGTSPHRSQSCLGGGYPSSLQPDAMEGAEGLHGLDDADYQEAGEAVLTSSTDSARRHYYDQ